MREQHVDTVTGGAAEALLRRPSLLSLGGVALAGALAQPAVATANKTAKRAKKCKKKTCKRQIDQCEDSVSFLCAQAHSAPDRDPYRAALLPSCGAFKGCRANTAVTCLVTGALSQQMPPERRRMLGRG